MGQVKRGTLALMLLHGGVWLLSQPFASEFGQATLLRPSLVLDGQLWRLFTYILPDSLMGVLIALISLFFFGPPVEQALGRKRLWALWASSTVAAGVLFTLAGLVFQVGYMAGPTAPLLALLAVWVRMNPHGRINVYFVLPVKALWVLGFVVLYRLLGMWQAQAWLWNVACELVGAAVGWWWFQLVALRWADLNPVERFRNWQYRRRMTRMKVHQGGRSDDPSKYVH